MTWIIDCSVACALFLPDEASPIAEDFFASLDKNDTIAVPCAVVV